jgi:hypothetical protein
VRRKHRRRKDGWTERERKETSRVKKGRSPSKARRGPSRAAQGQEKPNRAQGPGPEKGPRRVAQKPRGHKTPPAQEPGRATQRKPKEAEKARRNKPCMGREGVCAAASLSHAAVRINRSNWNAARAPLESPHCQLSAALFQFSNFLDSSSHGALETCSS